MIRRYAAGVDLSKTLRLPVWLDALLSHDLVAYPLHAGLGRIFNVLAVPPEIAGLEWLKAAAHARSERALARVVAGLTTSRRRAPSDDLGAKLGTALVRRVTCNGSDVEMRCRQIAALGRAGMPVAEQHARSRPAGEGLRCLLHPAGQCPPLQRNARSAATGR
jgi:hypothetical protein